MKKRYAVYFNDYYHAGTIKIVEADTWKDALFQIISGYRADQLLGYSDDIEKAKDQAREGQNIWMFDVVEIPDRDERS